MPRRCKRIDQRASDPSLIHGPTVTQRPRRSTPSLFPVLRLILRASNRLPRLLPPKRPLRYLRRASRPHPEAEADPLPIPGPCLRLSRYPHFHRPIPGSVTRPSESPTLLNPVSPSFVPDTLATGNEISSRHFSFCSCSVSKLGGTLSSGSSASTTSGHGRRRPSSWAGPRRSRQTKASCGPRRESARARRTRWCGAGTGRGTGCGW
jgi:hypothetical protein